MVITFKDGIQYYSVESLMDLLASGELMFLPKEYHIRRGLTPEIIKEKEQAITFPIKDTDGKGYVQIFEPLIFGKLLIDGELQTVVVSGNSRLAALQSIYTSLNHEVTFDSGKAAYTLTVTEYLSVPTRTINSGDAGLSYLELIGLQSSTNDTTKAHTPIQKAKAAIAIYEDAKAAAMARGQSPKEAGKTATEETRGVIVGMSTGLLSNYRQIIVYGTDKLFILIDDGCISVDASVALIQALKKKGEVKEDVLNAALENLANIAKTFQKSGATEELKITKSLVLSTYGSKEKTPPASTEELQNEAVKVDADDVDTSDDKPFVADEFTGKLSQVSTKLGGVLSNQLTYANSKDVAKLLGDMCQYIALTNSDYDAEESLKMVSAIGELFSERANKVSSVLEYANDEKLAKVNKLVNRIESSLQSIEKSIAKIEDTGTPVTESLELPSEAATTDATPVDDIDL